MAMPSPVDPARVESRSSDSLGAPRAPARASSAPLDQRLDDDDDDPRL